MKKFQYIKNIIEENDIFNNPKQIIIIIILVHIFSNETNFRICFEEKWENYYLEDLNPIFSFPSKFKFSLSSIFDQIITLKIKMKNKNNQNNEK
ncbi:hypothetical protein M0811_01174 [Anaeramoeba ignava]|uniref:Uncharacterized protein n=1 Tax=Anaeramoeba ignava TaxID=1746090 RepID=A0A9Q0LNA7_ANAIG|nr:hypothetical protein M0811_01174 [Anaeramoeba ignava]